MADNAQERRTEVDVSHQMISVDLLAKLAKERRERRSVIQASHSCLGGGKQYKRNPKPILIADASTVQLVLDQPALGRSMPSSSKPSVRNDRDQRTADFSISA